MKLVQKLAAATLIAASSFAVQATNITSVGGVTWDTDAKNQVSIGGITQWLNLDFSAESAIILQTINQTTGELSGFGLLSNLNGTPATKFCPGCELTFQFGGFSPVASSAVPSLNPGLSIDYKGGWFNIFVDYSKDATNASSGSNALLLTDANTKNGSLWLALVGNSLNGVTFNGSVSNSLILEGKGRLDVVGGLAAINLNTNTRDNGSDLTFSSSFTNNFTTNGGQVFASTGTGNVKGDSISAPSSLAVLGLGLLGLAGVARRKKSA